MHLCLQASIDVLTKFVLGKDIGRVARRKKKGRGGVLKRPVICICNDAYVPALRSLRQIALIVQFPPTSSSRLASLLLNLLGTSCLFFGSLVCERVGTWPMDGLFWQNLK
jgi:hypothetical protein